MQAGKLRHRVTIQKNTPVKDYDSGDWVDNWSDVATVWAAIEPLSAREFIAAQSTQSKVTARIVIRYRPGIDSSMRLLHSVQGNTTIYNIEGVLPDPNSGREYLTLPVSTGVNNG